MFNWFKKNNKEKDFDNVPFVILKGKYSLFRCNICGMKQKTLLKDE
jgi:hypothetical protein